MTTIGSNQPHEKPRRLVWLLWVAGAIAVIAFSAGVSLFAATIGAPFKDQPLSITACTPDSYEVPDPGERGPAQSECERWFQARGDSWPTDQPIEVAGQVCNDSDKPISYEIEVAFHAVVTDEDQQVRVLVIDTPITYDPGCHDPYLFAFEVPVTLTSSPDPLGQWRIVGRAVPTDNSRYAVYQWDATGTVELVNP